MDLEFSKAKSAAFRIDVGTIHIFPRLFSVLSYHRVMGPGTFSNLSLNKRAEGREGVSVKRGGG